MSERRDAVEVQPRQPGDVPAYVESYPPVREQRVGLYVAGRSHRGRVRERRHYADGREAVHLTLWPALPDGRRNAWFWWDLEAFEIRSRGLAVSPVEEHAHDGDAVRVHEVDVDPRDVPRYEGFDVWKQPRVQVRVGGRWHDALVWHKIRYRDGRHAVQCKVTFVEGDDWPVIYWRTYWWNPAAIRVMPGTGDPGQPGPVVEW